MKALHFELLGVYEGGGRLRESRLYSSRLFVHAAEGLVVEERGPADLVGCHYEHRPLVRVHQLHGSERRSPLS